MKEQDMIPFPDELTHHNENLIFDWRAPISGMFYDYDTGRAGFEASVGWIEGDLTRKRQFKIKDGIMEYAIESSTNVQDEVLQKELAHTSDEKMKSIISTIQREQNVIIRNESANTLIIQGVAGSGKTSIALLTVSTLSSTLMIDIITAIAGVALIALSVFVRISKEMR